MNEKKFRVRPTEHAMLGMASEGKGETLPESSGAAFNGLVDGAGEFPLWEVDSRK